MYGYNSLWKMSKYKTFITDFFQVFKVCTTIWQNSIIPHKFFNLLSDYYRFQRNVFSFQALVNKNCALVEENMYIANLQYLL